MLNGFGFSGYRSFGDELAKIYPLKKINFIIGKNNSGKSNIINFLNDCHATLTKAAGSPGNSFKPLDTDPHQPKGKAKARIAFPLSRDEITDFIKLLPRQGNSAEGRGLVSTLFRSSDFVDENGVHWFVFVANQLQGHFELEIDFSAMQQALPNREWGKLRSLLTGTSGGAINDCIREVLVIFSNLIKAKPDIELIPAIRKIGKKGSNIDGYSGSGIITRLAALQNPSIDNYPDKKKFKKLNSFVQTVLENPDVEIEIPVDRDMVILHMDEKILPLSSTGTGIQEVIILAVAATYLDETILCIEEPELHIHPLLQRKLLQYLSNNTTNKYIITTHSAHLLDVPGSEIFHVTHDGVSSSVTAINSTEERSQICHDLGFKASDLLQANCIIWVEGPSDRIYLNHWIKSLDGSLVEGVHYSIMFYGGRLFSHLTAYDDDLDEIVDDLIKIRKLNRNSIIVFDSDRRSSRTSLSDTKQRLENEFNEGSGFAWVTEGREIENYIDPGNIEECVLEVHSSAMNIILKGKWANTLKYKKRGSPVERHANKVKVSRYYVENFEADLSRYDLDEQITKVVGFIKSVNQ